MKKTIATIFLALMTATTATACPLWECNYGYYDYSCHCSQYHQVQPIYCQYCGNEQWQCTCGSYEEQAYSYSACTCMAQWANIRNECGVIIGQAGAGDSIEIYGTDCNDESRLLIYDYANGLYGSVLADCVYGTYQWDGTGDNGYYQSYQGSCGESYGACGGGYSTCYSESCGGYSTCYTPCQSYQQGCGRCW